jgi:hypothetical protein
MDAVCETEVSVATHSSMTKAMHPGDTLSSPIGFHSILGNLMKVIESAVCDV